MSERERSAALERAIRWLSDRRRETPDAKPLALAEEAARRFDLSPRDTEFLIEFARGPKESGPT
ncbi:MAG TPA: hypothetical protein VIN04_02255 [Myxococcota bacterium]